MMKLKLVVSGLVAAALFVPSPGAAYSRPLSEEVAEAIAPNGAEGEAAPAATTEAAPAAAPAPAATATAAPAPAATTEKKASASLTAEELEESSGFGIGVDLDNSMAASTFMAGATDAQGNTLCENCAFVGGSLGLSGRYTGKLAGLKFSVSARWGVSLEYTRPDNDNGRRFSHSNLSLGFSLPGNIKIPVVDIAINPSISLQVPLTAESWNSGLILGASAGVGASRSWKYLSVSLSGSISHGFYASTYNAGVQTSNYSIKDFEGRNTFLCRTGETICGIAGMNPALGIGGNLAVNIRPLDALSFGITFGLGKTWNYAVTDQVDEYTPKALDSNGNPVARTGMVARDRMSTNISASYSFTDNLAATLYLQNSQAPLTRGSTTNGATGDQWALRFPFADLATPAAGTTAIGLSLSGNFNF